MKAIDELRGFLSKSPSGVYPDEVLGYVDAIESELKERYIEGPKDAYGRPVRYGGYVKVYPYDGSKRKVKALRRSGFGWAAIFVDGGEESLYRVMSCEPPTVEDVLEKALNEAAMLDREEGYWPSAADITNLVNELAPKLRLKETDNELD